MPRDDVTMESEPSKRGLSLSQLLFSLLVNFNRNVAAAFQLVSRKIFRKLCASKRNTNELDTHSTSDKSQQNSNEFRD